MTNEHGTKGRPALVTTTVATPGSGAGESLPACGGMVCGGKTARVPQRASGRGTGGRPSRSGRVAVALWMLLGAIAGARGQQAPDLMLSLSTDDAFPGEVVRDQDVLFHAPGSVAHVCWPSETFALFTDETAQGLHAPFTDVDALHELNFGATAADRLLFSINTDEAGFKDGDIIGLGSAGVFEVKTAEAEFLAVAGIIDGNVDIDAYELDGDGSVLFSFGDNEASSFLSGDTPGTIKDGDVLYWPADAAAAVILYTETEINAFVTHALGSNTTTTDTTGLARDPVTGDVLFCVQSPTNQDASVFSVANGGTLLAGHAEADLGATGSPELDAICVAFSRHPSLTTTTGTPAAGSIVTLMLSDATPGIPHLTLAALSWGPTQLPLFGWGGLVLAPDALFHASLGSAPLLLILPDALGRGQIDAGLPAAIAPNDVVVQLVSPGPDLESSNPLLLELAQ